MATQFEEALGDRLVAGKAERFELPPANLKPLATALENAAGGHHGRAEVERALQLMVALRSNLASPTAATHLQELLATSLAARPHLEKLSPGGASPDAVRRFLQREGRSLPMVAPAMETQAEDGLRVRDLLSGTPSDPPRRSTGRPETQSELRAKPRRGQLKHEE